MTLKLNLLIWINYSILILLNFFLWQDFSLVETKEEVEEAVEAEDEAVEGVDEEVEEALVEEEVAVEEEEETAEMENNQIFKEDQETGGKRSIIPFVCSFGRTFNFWNLSKYFNLAIFSSFVDVK